MPAATKHRLLDLIDRAAADGWDHRRACSYLELGETRAWRWRERRQAGTLEDRRPGGGALHAITPDEEAAIVGVFEQHGLTDRSHRKLAHRGSYEQLVWVSASTVRRVLAAHGLRVRGPRRAGRSERAPFPEWAAYERRSIWIYDTTRFARCRATYVVMIMDLVTRKWICEIVSVEETGLQVQLAFTHALEREGLLDAVDEHQRRLADPTVDDPARPVLLAVSDNGPQMTSGSTREFLAMCAIAQHFGGPAPRPTRPGSRACSATSRPTGRTWTASPTPPSCGPSSPSCATSTTPSACMPASATSPRMTSTKAADPGSAKPAGSACTALAGYGSPTTAPSARSTRDPRAPPRAAPLPA